MELSTHNVVNIKTSENVYVALCHYGSGEVVTMKGEPKKVWGDFSYIIQGCVVYIIQKLSDTYWQGYYGGSLPTAIDFTNIVKELRSMDEYTLIGILSGATWAKRPESTTHNIAYRVFFEHGFFVLRFAFVCPYAQQHTINVQSHELKLDTISAIHSELVSYSRYKSKKYDRRF